MLNKTDVSMLYITIMGMASEGDGNKYWLDYANSNSLGVSSLANIMLDSPGAAKFFGDSLLAGNEKEFVTKIYSIALGSTSDVDGINYWTKAITGGGEFTDGKGNVINVASLSKGDLIGAMIDSMVNGGSAESKAIFEAKAAASDYFADATLGKDITGLDEGTTSKLISEITSASDLDKVKGEIDGLKESIDEAGLNKIALTTENDTITGTEGGDLISGVVSSLASENTLNAGDVIDGGAGSDILRVDLKSNFTGLDSNGVIKGVEKLSLLNSGLISRTFDAKGIKDVQTLALNSEKGIEVKNLANIADIELTNLQAANFNLDTIYAEKVLDGNADTQNLKVNGVGAQGASVSITADKIENLSLNATGKDSFLRDISSKDVSVKGNGNITLQAKAGVSSLDASASSGKVSADLTAANVKTIKGGSGDDKFVIGTSVANVSVDGGAGNDELEISGTGTLKPTVANVEKVTLNATGALTLAMDNAKDVSELNIKGDTGGVTVVNSNISALNFLSTATGTDANVTTVDSANLATINYKAGTEAGEVKGNLTATKATNLTVNTDALANITDANAIVTANVATSMSLNINAAKTAQSLTLNAAKLKDLVVTNKSVGGFTVKGTANSLDTLSNLNVTTDGVFKFETITGLAGVSTVTLSGTNDSSAVTLGTLGKEEATQGIALNASGLKAGLTVGNTSTKGSININLNAMSGNATLGTADSKTDNLTISANGVEGNFATGALTSAASTTVSLTNVKGASTIASLTAATASLAIENTGNVTITSASTASAGDFSINANNASGLTTNNITATNGAISINANGVSTIAVGDLSAKSVTLNAGDASTSVTAGAISAESVNVDLSKVLGATTVGKITSDNIVYKASELSADTTGKIELSSKGTTQNFKADVTGSLGNDKIALTTVATTSSVTLSGDLGVGNDTVEINKGAAVEALKSVNLSGLTNYASSETELKAAVSDTLTFNGGSGNDNVEVSGTAITSLTITGDFGEGGTDKLTLGKAAAAITGATNSAVTIDITKVTNVDSTEINFTNGAVDMSTKALTINGSNSNDQVTLKLVAATTKVKVDGDLGNQSGDEFTLDVSNAIATVTHIDLSALSTTKGIIDISSLTSALADVKGTKGNDIITLGDKASTAKGENISIDGGEGNDTFVFKDAAKVTSVSSDDDVESSVINNFAVGDKIKFESFDQSKTFLLATGNVGLASAIELKTKFVDAKITAVAGLDGVADGDIFAYVNGSDTYVVYNKAGGTADELDADDIVVKLAGVKVGTDFNLELTNGELHAVAIA